MPATGGFSFARRGSFLPALGLAPAPWGGPGAGSRYQCAVAGATAVRRSLRPAGRRARGPLRPGRAEAVGESAPHGACRRWAGFSFARRGVFLPALAWRRRLGADPGPGRATSAPSPARRRSAAPPARRRAQGPLRPGRTEAAREGAPLGMPRRARFFLWLGIICASASCVPPGRAQSGHGQDQSRMTKAGCASKEGRARLGQARSWGGKAAAGAEGPDRRRAGDGAVVPPPRRGGEGLPVSLRPDPAASAEARSSPTAASPKGEPEARPSALASASSQQGESPCRSMV